VCGVNSKLDTSRFFLGGGGGRGRGEVVSMDIEESSNGHHIKNRARSQL